MPTPFSLIAALLFSQLPTIAIATAEPLSIFQATLAETGEKAPEISTVELKAVLASKSGMVFDARPPREFAIGHIPGAVNVAGKSGVPMSQYVSDIRDIDRAVHGDKSTPIVLHCNGPFCGRSKRTSEELLAAGFTHVRRYQLGMPVWRALGGLQEIELEGLRYVLEGDKTALLLDARGTAELRGARGLTLSEVKKAKDDGRLPMEDHHTRIIVVGADAAQAQAVAAAVAHEAFDNVAFFAGDATSLRDIAGRQASGDAGAEVRSEEPPDSAVLTERLKGAEISLQQALAASTAEGKPISAKFEVEKGKLQLSVYIANGTSFSEVIVDHKTGRIARVEPIAGGDDLAAAMAQGEAMNTARTSLQRAVAKAAAVNHAYRAVSVTSSLKDGRSMANITLIKGQHFKTITERLD